MSEGMNKDELKSILEQHESWIKSIGGKRADLRWADMREADMRGADLRWANLRDANIDYACLPLWNTRPIEDALRVQLAARDALIERLVEVGNDIVEEAQVQEPDVQELRDNWRVLIAEWKASKDGGGE